MSLSCTEVPTLVVDILKLEVYKKGDGVGLLNTQSIELGFPLTDTHLRIFSIGKRKGLPMKIVLENGCGVNYNFLRYFY